MERRIRLGRLRGAFRRFRHDERKYDWLDNRNDMTQVGSRSRRGSVALGRIVMVVFIARRVGKDDVRFGKLSRRMVARPEMFASTGSAPQREEARAIG